MQDAEPFGTRIAVYTDRDLLPVALRAAARSHIAVIIRDQADPQQIRRALGKQRRVTVIADPGRWRHGTARPDQPLQLPDRGLTDTAPGGAAEGAVVSPGSVDLGTWAQNYRAGAGVDAVFTPSRFVEAGDWDALRALRNTFAESLTPDDRVVGLIATNASMLDSGTLATFLKELEPLGHLRLGFVFAGPREALAHRSRVTGLRSVLTEHRGAWLLGVDALIASDALCAGAGMVGIGIRSGMRWPAAPDRGENTPFARQGIPGRLHRDLLTYRSPVTYADWYFDSVPSACGVCGRPPDRYTPTPEGNNEIHEHNVHAAAALCEDLLQVDADKRADWLNNERLEAADHYRDLDRSQARVDIDPTLVALIRRDNPGWSAPVLVQQP
ncbi:MAG: hypothetical protein ABS80_17185 [Pseudonocardia sp. SCN 72-51]|nr:MAG: hypothetical protein ABS80_17185 [Pseudonocardia sp. SCN 72-51]